MNTWCVLPVYRWAGVMIYIPTPTTGKYRYYSSSRLDGILGRYSDSVVFKPATTCRQRRRPTHLVERAIGVSLQACRDEFWVKIMSQSFGSFIFLNLIERQSMMYTYKKVLRALLCDRNTYENIYIRAVVVLQVVFASYLKYQVYIIKVGTRRAVCRR